MCTSRAYLGLMDRIKVDVIFSAGHTNNYYLRHRLTWSSIFYGELWEDVLVFNN